MSGGTEGGERKKGCPKETTAVTKQKADNRNS